MKQFFIKIWNAIKSFFKKANQDVLDTLKDVKEDGKTLIDDIEDILKDGGKN